MNYYRYIYSVSLAFALLFLFACGKENKAADKATTESTIPEQEGHEETEIATLTEEQMKAVNVIIGRMEEKELTATIKANGRLRVPNESKANATALYGGVIKSLHVQLGTYVSKGQVIATIVNPDFVRLQEDYLVTTDKITLARQEVNRQQVLYDGNAGAMKNKQTAEAELRVLNTMKSSLAKQIALMGINPQKISRSNLHSVLSVKAPISGTVSQVFSEIGSYVDVTTPVLEIVDNTKIHLDLQVFERDLPSIAKGQTVHFTLSNNAGTEYDAKIYSIGSSFADESKTIAVHGNILGSTQGLIDGMNVTGLISVGHQLSPAVPNEAIVNADGKYYVFMLIKQQKTDDHDHPGEQQMEYQFQKVEIVKGVSELGYTAFTPVGNLPSNAQIIVKNAFFANAKLSNSGDHAH